MRECYLQVVVETDHTKGSSEFIKSQRFWTIEDTDAPAPGFKHFRMLLKFRSLADRKRFMQLYTTGRMLSKNAYAVRWSSWREVPMAQLRDELFNYKFDPSGPFDECTTSNDAEYFDIPSTSPGIGLGRDKTFNPSYTRLFYEILKTRKEQNG